MKRLDKTNIGIATWKNRMMGGDELEEDDKEKDDDEDDDGDDDDDDVNERKWVERKQIKRKNEMTHTYQPVKKRTRYTVITNNTQPFQ
jgi:hypothetical protein